jgi:ribosomal protein S18 acetylase RimI-like enzyme
MAVATQYFASRRNREPRKDAACCVPTESHPNGIEGHMSTRIRPYQTEDLATVAGVWHRAGLQAYPYLPTWQAFTLAEATDVFTRFIAPRCAIWVGVHDGEIVAYLAMAGSYIDRLYVDPAYQRQGWGRRLIAHAKALYPSGLELHTHQENTSARTLYEREGFVAVAFGISAPPESAPDVEYHWRPSQHMPVQPMLQ